MPHARNTQQRWATLPDAAAYVGSSISTIRRMVDRGEINLYRFGPRLVRVSLDEIDAQMRTRAR